MTRQARARLKLVGVFCLFLGPLGLAYLLYYGLSFGAAQTNKGELVDPVQRLPTLTLVDAKGRSRPSDEVLTRKWTILQVAGDGCNNICRQNLEETRQIRALLHRRASRVQRVLLVGETGSRPRLAEQPDLKVYRGNTAALEHVFAQEDALAPGMVYLVDPLGNWVLYYPPSGHGEGLFQDIKHLLKLSHIG